MEHVAIDLGSRESQVCVRTAEGTILEERRCKTQGLAKYLSKRPHSRVIVETSAEAFTVADAALAAGHQVRVVPATLARALGVGARGVKTDVRDARVLSEASCRIELPSVHVPSETARKLKAMCRAREALVTARTQLINTVRGALRTHAIVVRSGSATSFASRVEQALASQAPAGVSPTVPPELRWLLDALATLTAQVAAADEALAAAATSHPVCARLMSVPGVGPVTAVRFVSALDEVGRFADAAHVASYLGLTPGEHQSGQSQRRTHITKAGPARVRWVLVQAAWCLWRTRPHDPMAQWATEVAQRRGKPIAALALARKLAGVLFALWRDGTTFDPTHARTPRAPASLPPPASAHAPA